MSVYDELFAIYEEVHWDPDNPPATVATGLGSQRAIWDALLLLAARIDGDATFNPRTDRTIDPDEFRPNPDLAPSPDLEPNQ